LPSKAVRKFKAEIKLELEHLRAWDGGFVVAVPALQIAL